MIKLFTILIYTFLFTMHANASTLANNGSVALSIDSGIYLTEFGEARGSYQRIAEGGYNFFEPGTGQGLVLGGTIANGEGIIENTSIVNTYIHPGISGQSYIRIDTRTDGWTYRDGTSYTAINPTAPSDNGDGTFDLGAWIIHDSLGDFDFSGRGSADFSCYSNVETLYTEGVSGITATSNQAGDCSIGDIYTLDYFFREPFIFGGNGITQYQLHLEGAVVTVVPLPPSSLLFVSALFLTGLRLRIKPNNKINKDELLNEQNLLIE